MSEILVKMTRNWIVENIIRGSVVMIDNEGRIKAYCGDSYHIAYLRSAAKPIYAVPIVEEGAADAFALNPAEIAVACGSHIGDAAHTAAVEGILAKIGLTEDDLILEAELSRDKQLRDQRLQEQVAPRKVFNNCSGKHAAMLALCKHKGWNTEDYYKREHPLQQLMLRTVADFAVLTDTDVIVGIDGCGLPVHGMPLYNMALAYLNLCNSVQLAGKRQAAAALVLDAMTAEPAMVEGDGHFCTELIRVTKGRVIGKPGADGIFLAAERDGSWAMAIKIEDGNNAAVPATVIRSFRQMNILSEEEHQALRHFAVRPIKNCRGESVGEMKAAFHLELV